MHAVTQINVPTTACCIHHLGACGPPLARVAREVVLARDEEDAIAFCNEYAAEHLEILAKEPFAYLGRITNAGEILLGEHTPTTLGNFVIGPNHVLPTSGWAKTASAVSVFDFLKRNSIAYVTSKGYPELARHAHALATYEGFEAHANAVSPLRDKILKR